METKLDSAHSLDAWSRKPWKAVEGAAVLGIDNAQLELGRRWLSRSDPAALDSAIHWFEKAALQNQAEAIALLGVILATAPLPYRNIKRAVVCLCQPQSQAYSEARFALGWLTAYGLGVAQDALSALQLLKSAAVAGHRGAKLLLHSFAEQNGMADIALENRLEEGNEDWRKYNWPDPELHDWLALSWETGVSLAPIGLLAALRYRADLEAEARRAILLKAYTQETLPSLGEASDISGWGGGASGTRFMQLVMTLAKFRNECRRNPVACLPKTIPNCEADLAWLKKEIYDARYSYTFNWPTEAV